LTLTPRQAPAQRVEVPRDGLVGERVGKHRPARDGLPARLREVFAANAETRERRPLAYDGGVCAPRTMALVTVALAALLAAACRSTPACPEGAAADELRTDKMLALLRADAEGQVLLAEFRPRPVCYAPSAEAGVIASNSALLLPSGADERDLAARVAHLLLHAREGLPQVVAEGSCDEATFELLRSAEERAWALEERVRGRLGLAHGPGEAQRVVEGYRRRCQGLP